jgi:hypothetical protein
MAVKVLMCSTNSVADCRICCTPALCSNLHQCVLVVTAALHECAVISSLIDFGYHEGS